MMHSDNPNFILRLVKGCKKDCFRKRKFSVVNPASVSLLAGFLFFALPLAWSQEEEEEAQEAPRAQQGRESIRISVVAVNPSESKTQKIPIKSYLPEEVTPEDILNSSGLSVEFDTATSSYYLYKEDLELKPKELRTFQVELRDAWVIKKERLDALRTQAESMIGHLKGTEDYEAAQRMGEAIYKALGAIEQTQNDDTVSTKRHIGIYRNNQKVIEQVKEDIARLEKQASLTGAPPVPEVLENSNLNTNAPNKSTTWMIILIIMVFMGMLAGVFFLTWSTQARASRDVISEARDFAFPKKEPPSKDTKEKG